jgi:DNA replication protein DnaC
MNQITLDQLKQLKFYGMLNAFKSNLENGSLNEMTADELVSYLVQSEWDERHNRSITKKIYDAKFRYRASLEDLIYSKVRNLDKNQIHRFAECNFIDKYENIFITGSTGTGKSYLATALGYQACSLGYRVVYFNAPKLFSRLKIAKAEGTYLKEIAKIDKAHLLIIDDFGLQPLDSMSRAILSEIAEDKYERSSLIITSQLPVAKWHDYIGEQTVADAILDRLMHASYRVDLKGDSLRKKENKLEPLTEELEEKS